MNSLTPRRENVSYEKRFGSMSPSKNSAKDKF